MQCFYEAIKKEIDYWAPMDLLLLHSSIGEYDKESQEIFYTISETHPLKVETLSKVIFNVFIGSAGADVFLKSMDQCQIIAQRIYLNKSSFPFKADS